MPCEVKYRFDRVQYYNDICNQEKQFCYWYVIELEGYRVWRLLHKDCDCPCDCEDPERTGHDKNTLQLFSGECPEYLVPSHGLGEVSDLPETLQNEILPSNKFRKTRCAYAIEDCKIRFERYEENGEAFYYPVVIKQYNSKIPCTYINNQFECTEQSIFQCWESPDFDVTYDIDPIPEDEFEKLGLPEEVPCNIEIRCWPPCKFEESKVQDYWNELWPFFNNVSVLPGLSSVPIQDFAEEIRSRFYPFLPTIPQLDAKVDFEFDPYAGLSSYNLRPLHPYRRELEKDEPIGSCIYIILPDATYIYHTCPDGWKCPEIELNLIQKHCPEKTYFVTASGCERIEEQTTTTTTPSPTYPFCAWNSKPLVESFRFYYLEEDISFRDGLKIASYVDEEITGAYYDIKVKGEFKNGKFTSYDSYGRWFLEQRHCVIGAESICNDGEGKPTLFLEFTWWREDVPFPEEALNEALDRHKAKCGSIPFCCSESFVYSHDLADDESRGILPGLITMRALTEGLGHEALQTYGLTFLGRDNRGNFIYFFDESLFRSGPDKICKIVYSGGEWVASGTCDRCDIYVEMLNKALKACFRSKPHPYIKTDHSWRTPYDYYHFVVFDASKISCLCTVKDVIDFITQYHPIELYLSCPLDLPDSDFLIIDEVAQLWTGQQWVLYLPCGPTKAPITLPGSDLDVYIYVIPCVDDSENVEFQDVKRIFYAMVPWVYTPCLYKTTTTTTSTTTSEPIEEERPYWSPQNLLCN